MQLVDLILMACTLTNASACHEVHILFESAGSLQSCTMQAQPYLAQWRCAWPDQEDEKI
jgi:hypothetical protein